MRSMLLRQRTSVPGTPIHALVLSAHRSSMVGIDLASGAFVRVTHPEPATVPQHLDAQTAPAPPQVRARMFDVVVGRMADVAEQDLPPEHPEALVLARVPQVVGRMRGRQLDRYLRPALHPRNQPLLGFCGPSTPFWTIDHDRPSVALVQPESEPSVRVSPLGVRCSFRWQGHINELPVDDPRVHARLDWFPQNPLRGHALADVLGFRPGLVLLTLSTPNAGHCYKQATGLLPR